MVTAAQLRAGSAIRFEGETYKVLQAEHHAGQGRMGGATHARLKNLATGTLWEHGFRSDLKLEEVPLEKQPMDFLYVDGDDCYFMNPDTYEQVVINAALIGEQAKFLQPEMRLAVEFVNGNPASVLFPEILEVRIAGTAPPAHQGDNSAWKPARLESGVEIMVPQFVKTGDMIRLDVPNLKYMERVKVSTK